jgi:hypothetical protein
VEKTGEAVYLELKMAGMAARGEVAGLTVAGLGETSAIGAQGLSWG